MNLKPNAIKQIREALSLYYGCEFNNEEAEEIGLKLIGLYEAILKTNTDDEA